MKKQCTKCKKEKNYSEFFKDKRTKDGLYSACKGCHYDSQKSWREKDKKGSNNQKKWRERNRNNSNEYLKKWQKSNREKINQNHRGNPKYRLDQNMATSICNVLQGRKAGRTWKSLVGYSIDDLIRHLEKQFDDKMTWDNYGSYWWIDHRKARSLFKYETAEDPEFKKCWALENLQPLEKITNIKKSNKFG